MGTETKDSSLEPTLPSPGEFINLTSTSPSHSKSPLLLPQGHRKHTQESPSYNSLDKVAPLRQTERSHYVYQPTAPLKQSSNFSWKTFAGIICVILVVASWMLVAEALKILQKTYQKPIFIKWTICTGFAANILPALACWRIRERTLNRRRALSFDMSQTRTITINPSIGREDSISHQIQRLRRFSTVATKEKHGERHLCFSMDESWKFILAFSLCGFLNGTLWTFSLQQTSIGVNSVIYQSQVAFVFILSVLLFQEKVTVRKIMATALCIGGIIVIGFGTKNGPNETNTVVGLIEVVISTFMYSSYELLFESITKKFVDEQTMVSLLGDSFYFVGMAAVFCGVLFWPVLVVVDWLGIEKFVFPTAKQWLLLVLVWASDITLNTCVPIGIGFTNAVYMAMGQLLVVPAGFITDFCVNGTRPALSQIGGALLIVTGFLLFQFSGGAKTHETQYEVEGTVDVRSQGKSVF